MVHPNAPHVKLADYYSLITVDNNGRGEVTVWRIMRSPEHPAQVVARNQLLQFGNN
jgi:hypothetical protein